MTAQNVVFLAILAVIGISVLFHLNFILQHLGLTVGCVAAAVGALVFATRKGLVDWEEWIPRGRE